MKYIYKIFSFIVILCFFNISVYAVSVDELKEVDYTDEYKRYINLSEEEKREFSIIPSPYSVPNAEAGKVNPIKKMVKVGAANETRFSLKDNGWLPNLTARNQLPTTLCWAFSSLSSLETNLSLKNRSTYYDFSESHMDYATTRNFLNNQKNNFGINRLPGDTATWYVPVAYLTNGQGAVDESDMPFDNFKDKEANHTQIEIDNIKNKEIKSEVFDIEFYPSNMTRNEAIEEIKKNIKLHGSVAAQVYGATLLSNYYNEDTGALFREDDARNHAVSIIGWDDSYPVTNFNSQHRPNQPGAWIVRNSWGETMEYNGRTYRAGDNGFMYISYEDGSIYKSMIDVSNASEKITYDHIYQYDEQGYVDRQMFLQNQNKIYLGNYYQKKSAGNEFLTHVGIFATETYTCKVFVNPNGRSMSKYDLQQVTLKEGDGKTETFNSGYHTLEFKDPVKLTSDEFAVVLEISGAGNQVSFALEANYGDAEPDNDIYRDYTDINISDSKCFLTSTSSFETNDWLDLTKLHQISESHLNSDSTIKAFTTNDMQDSSLNSIEITHQPNKIQYTAGENFNPDGMTVIAHFNDGTTKTLATSEYSITGGTNLKDGQTNITISYEGKTATQLIQVTPVTTPVPTPTTATVTPTSAVTPTQTPTITPTTTVSPTQAPTITPKTTVSPTQAPTITPTTTVSPTQAPTITPKTTVPPASGTVVDTENPKNSSFNNIVPTVNSISQEAISVSLNNFTQAKNNDNVEYYYYLSDSKNSDLTKAQFIKINNPNVSTNSLKFSINKNDIPNLNELEIADKVYLYVREFAILGGNRSVATSAGIELKITTTTSTQQSFSPHNPMGDGLTINDDTVAKDPIPQTGVSHLILGLIVLFAVISGVIYIKYIILNKKINR